MVWRPSGHGRGEAKHGDFEEEVGIRVAEVEDDGAGGVVRLDPTGEVARSCLS